MLVAHETTALNTLVSINQPLLTVGFPLYPQVRLDDSGWVAVTESFNTLGQYMICLVQ